MENQFLVIVMLFIFTTSNSTYSHSIHQTTKWTSLKGDKIISKRGNSFHNPQGGTQVGLVECVAIVEHTLCKFYSIILGRYNESYHLERQRYIHDIHIYNYVSTSLSTSNPISPKIYIQKTSEYD